MNWIHHLGVLIFDSYWMDSFENNSCTLVLFVLTCTYTPVLQKQNWLVGLSHVVIYILLTHTHSRKELLGLLSCITTELAIYYGTVYIKPYMWKRDRSRETFERSFIFRKWLKSTKDS